MNFYLQMLFRTILEFSLFIFLQFSYANFVQTYNSFSFFVSLFCFIYLFLVCGKLAHVLNNNDNFYDKKVLERFGSLLYELNITDESPFFWKNFPFMVLIRKPIFSFVLVFLYNYPMYQTLAIIIIQVLYFILNVYYNPYKTRFERFVNLFIEVQILFIFTLAFTKIVEPSYLLELILMLDLIIYVIMFCIIMTVYFILILKETPCYRYLRKKCIKSKKRQDSSTLVLPNEKPSILNIQK